MAGGSSDGIGSSRQILRRVATTVIRQQTDGRNSNGYSRDNNSRACSNQGKK